MSDRASKALAEASLLGEPRTYMPHQNAVESLSIPFIIVHMDNARKNRRLKVDSILQYSVRRESPEMFWKLKLALSSFI